ncbi:hypothetical protein [Methylobacter sp.]|uniref:hypothetical protein n=1 Tax=Methylobacter sp. TaxID=2051955 RepID=UPI002FDD1046
MQAQSSISLGDIVPYQSIPEKFPHLYSPKSWAWAVKQRHHNGLAKAFRKVGKNLFVNIQVLAECIDAQLSD